MVRVHDPRDARTSRLPAPVARYLALALDARLEAPERVVLRQSGELKTQPEASRWLAFDAVHTIRPRAASFEWDARVALWPGIRLRVVDAFVDGHGSGRVTLWSLPLARDAANPWIDAGSLHRLLGIAGLEIVVPRRQTFYGMDEIGVREPGGHVVMFAQPTG